MCMISGIGDAPKTTTHSSDQVPGDWTSHLRHAVSVDSVPCHPDRFLSDFVRLIEMTRLPSTLKKLCHLTPDSFGDYGRVRPTNTNQELTYERLAQAMKTNYYLQESEVHDVDPECMRFESVAIGEKSTIAETARQDKE